MEVENVVQEQPVTQGQSLETQEAQAHSEGLANQQPEQRPNETQEEFFLRVNERTAYKTPEAAIAGIDEKDRFIAQLLAERSQPVQQQGPVAPVDPQAQEQAIIAEIAKDFEQAIRSDPKYANADPEAIADQAYLSAKAAYLTEQRIQRTIQRSTMEQKWEQTLQATPELHTDTAKQVYDRYVQQYGTRPQDPQHHLDLVHAEMYRRLQTGQQQQPAYNGVNGAAAQLQQQGRIFQNSGGSTAPTPQAPIPQFIQDSVNEYMKAKPNATQDDINRVIQHGRQIEAEMNRGKFQ